MAFGVWLLDHRTNFSRSIHVISCINTRFFLWLNNILLYKYATLLFIYSCVPGHLCCFHFELLHNPVLNTHMQVFQAGMFSLLLGIHLGTELLGPMVVLCFLSFKEWHVYFPKQLYHVRFLSATYEGFSLFTYSAVIIFHCFLYYIHPSRYEVISHWDYD